MTCINVTPLEVIRNNGNWRLKNLPRFQFLAFRAEIRDVSQFTNPQDKGVSGLNAETSDLLN